jgi:hypothetical protein
MILMKAFHFLESRVSNFPSIAVGEVSYHALLPLTMWAIDQSETSSVFWHAENFTARSIFILRTFGTLE